MLIKVFLLLLFIFQLSYSYKSNPTQYICTESSNTLAQTLPSCLPGYILDIENVIYESTRDNTCSGTVLCQVENRNAFLFACNRKRTCQIDLNNLRFHINSTCGTTTRFFVHYRCLPVIQEQKDYLCDSATLRRPSLGDINLSCVRNYRLHITMAMIGISLKPPDETRLKCNKETQTACNTYVPNGYQDVCDRQSKQECKITYNQRPMLSDCPYGIRSNFSLVEYWCIPDEGIIEDLPRFDICSKETPERISSERGLLHSQNSPEGSCRKELFLPRESRLRLFMLTKSGEYAHELNIDLLKNIRRLGQNELFDVNITNPKKDEIVKFEQVGSGQFLLYFQVDSRISEYAPFDLEFGKNHRRGRFSFIRDWAILIGCILLLLLLLIIIIFIIVRISKRRRYSKTDHDDHHLQIEQPYLASSVATILPSTHPNRPHSASSTTSSIIMHQINDGLSDRESLIKPIGQIPPRSNTDIDNFYEEIKEQQQQTALALGMSGNKGQQSVPPIRDHHETEPRYQQPRSADEDNQQIKRSKKPPPQKKDPKPSAPPRHLLENND